MISSLGSISVSRVISSLLGCDRWSGRSMLPTSSRTVDNHHYDSSSSRAFACFRSGVSKPSVNQL